jgi:hypothetical protein
MFEFQEIEMHEHSGDFVSDIGSFKEYGKVQK